MGRIRYNWGVLSLLNINHLGGYKMTKRVRVAVTGPAGQIGYAIFFRIASGQMFGTDVQVDLNFSNCLKPLEHLRV